MTPTQAASTSADPLRFTYAGPDDERLVQGFERFGAVVVRGLVSPAMLDELRREIRALIELARVRAGLGRALGTRFDAGFAELCAHDPGAEDAIFAACRRLASVHRLSVAPELLASSRLLMDSELVMVPPYKPVRIDWTRREHALLPWHQDYPYAQDSPDAVVYWIPLVDVDEDNGCLEVAPGSHAAGIRPVEMLPPAPGQRVWGLQLAEAEPAGPWPTRCLPMAAGDALILRATLLHRSRPNRTERARWTVQIRHGNFCHPTAVAKRWPRGHYESHWFHETHPEHVRAPNEQPSDERSQP